VHKLAEYNVVNKDVSRGHDSRRVVAAAFLAMQTEVSACLRRHCILVAQPQIEGSRLRAAEHLSNNSICIKTRVGLKVERGRSRRERDVRD
jgi:hypothetical protein